jgi:predicted TIM-barrel fold metal-dependent hydrolase
MRKFEDEAIRVFERYPDLTIIVPHCALWSGLLSKLDALLDKYPALYTDLSFGWWYTVPAFKRFDKDPRKFREFLVKHQDRVLFGTDVVITAASSKSTAALTDFFLSYRCVLELEEFDFRDRNGELFHYKGLALPEDVVRKIYRDNFVRLLERTGR